MAKMEIYRRWVSPYEDLKKEENGDLNGNNEEMKKII